MRRSYIVPAIISASLYAGLLFGFKSATVQLGPDGAPPDEERVLPLIKELTIEPEKPEFGETSEPVPEVERSHPPRLPDRPTLNDPSRPPIITQPLTRTSDLPPTNYDIIPPDAGTQRIGSEGTRPIFSAADLENNPRARFQPEPAYPHDLKAAHIEGWVEVDFVVETDGSVTNLRVRRSSHGGFERPTAQAVERWRFDPGRKEGKKVRFRVSQVLNFTITD